MEPTSEELLAAMEISGVVPNSTDQQHRLDQLLAEGFCCREARTASGQISVDSVYRLTDTGRAYLEHLRGGNTTKE